MAWCIMELVKMKNNVLILVFAILLIGLVSAAWWNPFSWGGRDANYEEEVDSNWPTMAIGEMGYGRGMMGSIYDDSFIDRYPKEELSEKEREALMTAMSEEFFGRAMYVKSIEQFGESMPFSQVLFAEGTHINALERLFEKYELDIPVDNWAGTFEDYDNFYDACRKSVDGEIRNIDAYARLFSDAPRAYPETFSTEMSTGGIDNLDINEVFSLLQWGSSMHLRAFQMCSFGGMGMQRGFSDEDYGRGLGLGQGMGSGMMGSGR